MTGEEQRNSENLVTYFLLHLEKLSCLSLAEGRDVLQLASYTAIHSNDYNLKNKCLDLLYYSCFYIKNLDMKELWNIYWILTRALFADNNTKITEPLDELYRLIFTKVLENVTDPYEKLEHTDSNLVIVTTGQFLGSGHAPTRRTLDYAYTIATELKKQVMIINDAGLNFYPCACLEQNFLPNYLEELTRTSIINYKGMRIPFMQLSGYMPDIYVLNETLRKIYQLRPELVYNIGGSSLLSDLCALFTKTACLPCSTSIPSSMSKYLLVGRKLEETDEKRLERLEPYQEIIETVINYELAVSNTQYHRSAFNLSPEHFVIGVVGNRLDEEASDEFILLVEKAIQKWNVHFLFIGEIHNTDRFKSQISQCENIHLAGMLPEASQAMTLFNLYWNPKRSGGGRSSFEALAHGVPVVTLKHGDVYYTCGEPFSVNTYEDYLERTKSFIEDPEYCSVMKENALKRAAYLSDLPKTQGEILDKIFGNANSN